MPPRFMAPPTCTYKCIYMYTSVYICTYVYMYM